MPRLTARVAVAAIIGVAALTVVGCVPEPASENADPDASATAEPTEDATAEPSPEVTPASALPESCEEMYSPEMLVVLERETPPLNDTAVTMLSTQNTDGLELLDSGVPTIRCSWGPPSDRGMSTNVSYIDGGSSTALQESLRQSGFVCEDSPIGLVCTIEERGVDLDDVEYVLGEVHAFPEGGWVATRWINYLPEGYTDDVVTTVWG